ncbi:MAG TPA: hypothetical protein VF017_13355 [Thermoanaerobaculia bacterium]|nr:hypothetical protein [Thermoanaerobaculia bacterium]
MNLKRFVMAGLAGGIVLNGFDFVVHGNLLQSQYYSQNPSLFRPDAPLPWLITGDFVAAFVLAWVWARVEGSFGSGAKGGALGGFYAGVLVNFPTWIFSHLLFVGFPYSLSWVWTVTGIVSTVLVGAVIGAIYRK